MASARVQPGRLASLLLAVGLLTILAGGTAGPALAGGGPTVTLTSPAGGWSGVDSDGGHELSTIAAPSAHAGTPLLVGLGLVLVAIGIYLVLGESPASPFR